MPVRFRAADFGEICSVRNIRRVANAPKLVASPVPVTM
jgi:hypothetical protein